MNTNLRNLALNLLDPVRIHGLNANAWGHLSILLLDDGQTDIISAVSVADNQFFLMPAAITMLRQIRTEPAPTEPAPARTKFASVEATMAYSAKEDKDLFEHYSPFSLLMASPADGWEKMSEMIECGKTYRITIEEIGTVSPKTT